jgi:hypothetical protein
MNTLFNQFRLRQQSYNPLLHVASACDECGTHVNDLELVARASIDDSWLFWGTTLFKTYFMQSQWFIAKFHSNRDTIKSILLKLLENDPVSDLIDVTENSKGLGEEFEFEKMETTELEDMVYQNSDS